MRTSEDEFVRRYEGKNVARVLRETNSDMNQQGAPLERESGQVRD